MFYITRSRLLALLCYVRFLNVDEPPEIIRVLRRIIRVWGNSVRTRGALFSHSLSRNIVLLDGWNLNEDVVYVLTVSILLEILEGCWRAVFPLPLIGAHAAIEHTQLSVLGLTEIDVGHLLILQSQIMALMSGPDSSRSSFSQNTCSLLDVTLISSPIAWLRNLFPLENCRVEAFVHSSSLRNLFLSEWSGACTFPHVFFRNEGVERFLVRALGRRGAHQRVFFSLPFVLVWFIAFFIRFSENRLLSEAIQESILRVVFEDFCKRILIFNEADLSLFLFRSLFHFIGSVCAAGIPTAWEDHLPLMLRDVELASGDRVYHCVPVDEARLIAILRQVPSGSFRHFAIALSIYGENGREQICRRFSPRVAIGDLGGSLIWRTWRSIYLPIFSNLFSSINYRTPGSLSDCAAKAVLLYVRRGTLSVNSSVFLTLLNRSIGVPSYESNSLRLRFSCLMHHVRYVDNIYSWLSPEANFVILVQNFFLARGISINSSEAALEQRSQDLVSIMRFVPFCRYPFSHTVCMSYLVAFLIEHLFGIASCLPENRARFMSLGPRRIARCLWRLVSQALLFLRQGHLVSNETRIQFLRTCFVLYDRYFVRRRPFSQEENDDED